MESTTTAKTVTIAKGRVIDPCRRFVPVIAALCLVLSSCATQGESHPSAVTLESEIGSLHVELVARQGSGEGEVCATSTVRVAGELDGVNEECGSTAPPTPIVAGYFTAEMRLEGFTYSWGVLRTDVDQIVPSENVAVDYKRMSLRGYSDCCVLYLAVVRGDDRERALADLSLLDSAGSVLETLPLQLPGAP